MIGLPVCLFGYVEIKDGAVLIKHRGASVCGKPFEAGCYCGAVWGLKLAVEVKNRRKLTVGSQHCVSETTAANRAENGQFGGTQSSTILLMFCVSRIAHNALYFLNL